MKGVQGQRKACSILATTSYGDQDEYLTDSGTSEVKLIVHAAGIPLRVRARDCAGMNDSLVGYRMRLESAGKTTNDYSP
jgi:hypothetical protein